MKTILIIGGAGSLGQAIANNLKDKYKIIITAVNDKQLELATHNTGCDGLICDITIWDSIQLVIKTIRDKYSSIDVLINCAGLYTSGKIEDIDPVETKRVFEVNTIGPLLSIKAVTSMMKQNGGGHIININSIGGLTQKTERSVYYGSKWGLAGVSKNLQKELSPFNIKISEIFPAALEAKMVDKDGFSEVREKAVSHKDVVDTVEYILERSDNVHIPSVVLRDINYK